MKKKVIITLRVLAVLLFIGIIAAYICIPHSHMPDGIRTLLSNMKHSLSSDSNPPLILLISWMLLLIVEIPFALEIKNDNNIFADEYRDENKKSAPAPRHTAVKKAAVNAERKPNIQSAKAKPTDKKAPAVKHTAEKRPTAQKTTAKQVSGERPKPRSQKAPERKPAERKPVRTPVTNEVKAQKPTRAPVKAPANAASRSAAPQRKPAPQPAAAYYERPVRPKAPSYTADYIKTPLDDESFDQFLNDLKQDYLNN